MATTGLPVNSSEDGRELREEWLGRLSALMTDIRQWAGELGWSVREVVKRMRDSEVGDYEAVGLVLQKDFVKVLMDPIARSAPGTQGVVDFYLMPGLDDVASLYFYENAWNLHHYVIPGASVADAVGEASGRRLTEEALGEVLRALLGNVS